MCPNPSITSKYTVCAQPYYFTAKCTTSTGSMQNHKITESLELEGACIFSHYAQKSTPVAVGKY